MERVLFLGSYGFHNFGDELCLVEALKLYPHAQHWTHSANPAYTARCTGVTNFITCRRDIRYLRPTAVVVGGGGVGFLPSIRDHLHWALDAVGMGAKLHIHNIGVAATTAEDRSWLTQNIIDLISGADEFTVRDEVSQRIASRWTGRIPGITLYPEVNLSLEYFQELDVFPVGRRLMGISVTNQKATVDLLRRQPNELREALSEFKDCLVVPVVSCLHPDAPDEDDVNGFLEFKENLLSGFDVLDYPFLDREFIRGFYTPSFIRTLISRLDVLFSQRKHNCIHAIGAGTRVIGFSSVADDSIKRVFDTLENRLPRNSRQMQL